MMVKEIWLLNEDENVNTGRVEYVRKRKVEFDQIFFEDRSIMIKPGEAVMANAELHTFEMLATGDIFYIDEFSDKIWAIIKSNITNLSLNFYMLEAKDNARIKDKIR